MSSSSESNKQLVKRFFDAIESADFGAFDQIVALDYNDHLQGQTPGREALKRYFAGLHSAFADLRLPIAHMVAEDDKVAVLNSVQGTHHGNFPALNLDATGRRIDAMAFQLYRVENSQLAEHWEVADFATLARQLQG